MSFQKRLDECGRKLEAHHWCEYESDPGKIIMKRLKEAYEKHIGEEKYGFRRNRSTSDGIFIVRNVIEKYGEAIIAVYIYLTAAYDHAPLNYLFRVLHFCTGASHLIALLKRMYKDTTASIRGTKAKFNVLVGCRHAYLTTILTT